MSDERVPDRAGEDPGRAAGLGRRLTLAGVVGMSAALLVGVIGWVISGRVTNDLTTTIEPIGAIVADVADTIDASRVLVSQTTEALTSIEDATRSAARTIESVGGIIAETGSLAGGDIADSLESAVATLPGLIDTARVVDRTMRTLSLVGVDYDPQRPLDESLGELEASLEPVPDQIRAQVALLDDVESDLNLISQDADELAALLLRARVELRGAEQVLLAAAQDAEEAAAGFTDIESDLGAYGALARLVSVLVAVALATAAMTPLLLGRYHSGRDGAVA